MDARHVLFFIYLESRRVSLAGITRYPDEGGMEQVARQLGKQSPASTTQVMPVHRRTHALSQQQSKTTQASANEALSPKNGRQPADAGGVARCIC